MEKSLKDLLSRLPIPGLAESTNRHLIADEITNLLGVEIKPKQITVKDEILTISVPPVVKSALQVKKEELLRKLNEKGITLKNLR